MLGTGPRSRRSESSGRSQTPGTSVGGTYSRPDPPCPTGPIVAIPNVGKVEGVDLDSLGHPTIAEFRGIPYAQPPVGPLRWQPPEPHPGWGDDVTFKGTAFGNECMQPDIGQPGIEKTYEDCLFLNIVTPKSALESGAKKLPVMVNIHGGNFIIGKGNEPDDPRVGLVSSSKESIVLVTFNYRLGVFGFLASSEMMERTNGKGSGNFGIQDQRQALTWIKANIGAFGGDSDAITIFGQSSGGSSVFHHLTQPASFESPLYQKAIIQSGTYHLGAKTMSEVEEIYKDLLVASGCTDLTCLVDRDAESLVIDSGNPDWLPVVDGVSLTNTPSALIAAKRYNNEVPVIIGSMRDEYAGWMETYPGGAVKHNLTEEEFDTADTQWLPGLNYPFSEMEPAKLAELKRVYDPEVYPYPADLGNYSIWYWMDMRFHVDLIQAHGACSVRWIARLLHEGGTPAVYSFLFAHPVEYFPDSIGSYGVFATHGIDIAFLADIILDEAATLPPGMGIDRSDIPSEDRKLAQTMAAYWVSFAKNGDPNLTGGTANNTAVTWPKFTTEGDTILRLDVESAGGFQVEKGLRKEACDWQTEQALAQGILVNPDGGMSPYADATAPLDNDDNGSPSGTVPRAAGDNNDASSSCFCHASYHLHVLISVSSIVVTLLL